MKKILIISPFSTFPPYWGGANRIYNLVKYLAKQNKVVLLCNNFKQIKKADIDCNEYNDLSSNSNVKLHFVKSLGRGSQIFNPLVIIKGLKIIRKEKADFIMAEFAWSGLHAIFLRFLCQVPYILDEHNVEFLRFERMRRGNRFGRYMLKGYEKVACSFASKIFCVSETDKDFLTSKLGVNKEKIVIILNGVDTDKFYPNEQKRMETRARLKFNKEKVILFFGKLDYKPNYEAVKIIRYEILQRVIEKIPDAKFLIVGDNPPLEFVHKSIIFTGMVENIEDYINVSDVVICPLLSGGGTRIKILEAMACGKIVVSTSIGAEGLIKNADKDFLKIADNWDRFAKYIINFSKTENDFLKNSFYSVLENYSWDSICEVVNNEFNK